MSQFIGQQAPDFTATGRHARQQRQGRLQAQRPTAASTWCCSSTRSTSPSSARPRSSRSTTGSTSSRSATCEVIGVSVDSPVHATSPGRTRRSSKGGIGQVQLPAGRRPDQADRPRLRRAAPGRRVALRGTFLIDKDGVVRHQVVNDLPLGRNVDEALRMVDALQHREARRGLPGRLDTRARRP